MSSQEDLGLFESIKALSTIQPKQIRRYDRMDVVVKFMRAKKEHPNYKKNQLCALIGVSDSHLKRVMKDLDVQSFYRHDIPANKKKVREKTKKDSRKEETKVEKKMTGHKTLKG